MPPTAKRNRYLSNEPLEPWSHLRVWLFCGGVLMLLYGLSRDPQWVEKEYVDGFGGTIASWLDWFSAPVPLSIAEILLGLLVAWAVFVFLSGLAEVGARRRQWHNALFGFCFTVVDLTLVLGAWFYLSFGVAYARPPAAERFGLPVAEVNLLQGPERAAFLRDLALLATARTNQAYRELHGKDDAGTVTRPAAGNDPDAAIERAYVRLGRAWMLPGNFGHDRGPTKKPFGSVLLSWLGIAGVYAPFTGEANVNKGPPAWSQLVTVAHEKAHQRLVASEDEATFVGVEALLHSDEPLLRYAGWQEVRRQLQRALVDADPDGLKALQGKLSPGPQRDLIALSEYWENYKGPWEHVGTEVNDRYLRLHHVEGGVESYARASVLFAAWSQTTEGKSSFKGR